MAVSAFAAQIANKYAPELPIQGAVVLAPGLLPVATASGAGLLAATQPSGQTGFVMEIAASWSRIYPDQMTPADILTPGVAKLPIVDSVCGKPGVRCIQRRSDVDLREGSGSSDLLHVGHGKHAWVREDPDAHHHGAGNEGRRSFATHTRVRQTALPDGGTPSTSISIRTTLTQAWWSHRETLCSPGSRIDSTATPAPTNCSNQ